MVELKYRTCNLCEAMCGMVVTVDGGRITDVRGDRDDVLSRGHICPKGPAMRELHEDPDRLRRPQRRGDAGFAPVGWDEAIEEAASRIAEIQDRHGKNFVGVYLGNPTAHNHGAILMAQALFAALGTRNRFDANSQDANPKIYVSGLMYGDLTALTVPDIDRTDHFLMLGANPAASGGSVMTLGDTRGRVKGIRERGGKLVVVDPRRTETAAWASEHHFIRPGGDAALLLAMLHVIFAEGLCDSARVAEIARGLSSLRALAARFAPERVHEAVGIDAETIRRMARELAGAKRAVAYGRVGVCTNEHGATATWLIEALNVVTGNFDREGGSMFTKPAIDLSGTARRVGVTTERVRRRTRVRGLPAVGGMFPATTIADEIETPGDGQIRALITLAGNPVLSVPGGERLTRALGKLDFMLSIDIYLNETTRHAHLVLPPRSALERGHYDLIFHTLAVRNTVKWSEPVVASEPDTRDDWDILHDLTLRIAGKRAGPFADRAAKLALELGRLGSERVIDAMLRMGPYGDRFLPWKDGLNLDKVRRAPHGIDLGPLVPMRHERLRTAGKLVELCPGELAADVDRVERWLERPPAPLSLIGRRHMRSNNSWMHNVRSLVKGPDRATLMMHPLDAEGRGLAEGAAVQVKSRAGEARALLEITDDVMPGIVSLPHGFGHAPAAATLRVAGAVPGPNVNEVTDAHMLEPITGTAVLNGVPVTVEAIAAAAE